MIKLSNGHVLKYVVASGALGFDGQGYPWELPLVRMGLLQPELFTVVLKTLTRHPREGNLKWWKPWECIRLIPGGSVNKVGLTNMGIDQWCDDIGLYLDFKKASLIASIYGTEGELVEMAKKLNCFKFVAIQINGSCPNAGSPLQEVEGIVRSVMAVRRVSRHPIIVKVSAAQNYLSIALGLKGVAEAIDLNSVPWEMAFPEKRSPLWKLQQRVGGGGGGVSGKPAQKHNWKAVRELATQGILPVIGPDIMDRKDLYAVRLHGARAFSFGAIHLRTPWKPTSIVRKEEGL